MSLPATWLGKVLLQNLKKPDAKKASFFIFETQEQSAEALKYWCLEWISAYWNLPPQKPEQLLNQPDLLSFSLAEERKNFVLEDFYELPSFLSLNPLQQNHKFVVVEKSEAISESTLPKWLKMLEEPPLYVTFIWLKTKPTKLAPTIQSRALYWEIHFENAPPFETSFGPDESWIKLQEWAKLTHSTAEEVGKILDLLKAQSFQKQFGASETLHHQQRALLEDIIKTHPL
jgi:hypothetical protein